VERNPYLRRATLLPKSSSRPYYPAISHIALKWCSSHPVNIHSLVAFQS